MKSIFNRGNMYDDGFPVGRRVFFPHKYKTNKTNSLYLMTGDMQLFFSTCHIEDKSSFLICFLNISECRTFSYSCINTLYIQTLQMEVHFIVNMYKMLTQRLVQKSEACGLLVFIQSQTTGHISLSSLTSVSTTLTIINPCRGMIILITRPVLYMET